MTPLERAARALSDGPHPSEWCWEKARAVIKAIREPSEAMVDAWMDATLELPDGMQHDAPADVVDPYQARSDWRAMIDALLEEGA